MSDHPDPIEELRKYATRDMQVVLAAYDAKCDEVERLNDVLKTSKVLETFKSFEKCSKALDTANAQIVVLRESLELVIKWSATNSKKASGGIVYLAEVVIPKCNQALSTTSDNPVERRLREAEAKAKELESIAKAASEFEYGFHKHMLLRPDSESAEKGMELGRKLFLALEPYRREIKNKEQSHAA